MSREMQWLQWGLWEIVRNGEMCGCVKCLELKNTALEALEGAGIAADAPRVGKPAVEYPKWRTCTKCGHETDSPEGSFGCPEYNGRTGDYCPIFVDGVTRAEQERHDRSLYARMLADGDDPATDDRVARVMRRVALWDVDAWNKEIES